MQNTLSGSENKIRFIISVTWRICLSVYRKVSTDSTSFQSNLFNIKLKLWHSCIIDHLRKFGLQLPRPCNKSVSRALSRKKQNRGRLREAYVWHTCGILMTNQRLTCGIRVAYVWHTQRTSFLPVEPCKCSIRIKCKYNLNLLLHKVALKLLISKRVTLHRHTK